MTETERQLLQQFVDQTHRQFIRAVAEGRGMDTEKVEAVADGRIFTGEDALSLGLIDRLGNLADAVDWAGERGGMTGEIDSVYARDKRRSIVAYLLESIHRFATGKMGGLSLFPAYIYQPGAAPAQP
jgi:protease-4